MALIFKSGSDSASAWRAELTKLIPDLDFRVWPEVGDPKDIDFALVWGMPEGAFDAMVNLKAICSLGHGVDHILRDPNLPKGVHICRLVDPWMVDAMSEWVIWQVLRFHRQGLDYEDFQRRKVWKQLPAPETGERRVGVLGLGALGADAAVKLARLGFPTAGWSRTPKDVEGVVNYVGEGGLEPFLRRTDIVCCLLPLTRETEDILNARTLALLPKGAFVVNSARGRHIVEDDLLAALDSGHIAGAALDVFRTEPLPGDHPFWTHPKVLVTPHVSALTNVRTGAEQVAESILKVRRGLPPNNIVEPSRGY